jgi:hypothetical protein
MRPSRGCPFLRQGIRWHINSRQLFQIGDLIDHFPVYGVSIDSESTPEEVEHILSLGRSGVLSLSDFVAEGANDL